MKQIKLDSTVVVSDPSYTIPTWCQIILDNVLPGTFFTTCMTSNEGMWGDRNALLVAVHEDNIKDELDWEECPGTVGVDSGQAGIFSRESYQNDSHPIEKGEVSFGCSRGNPGDEFYDKMCQRTLGEDGWGFYDQGVVSRSGFGDGSYSLFIAKRDGKVVGMMIDFGVVENIDFNFYLEEEYKN